MLRGKRRYDGSTLCTGLYAIFAKSMWLHLDKPNAQIKQVAWQVVVKGGKPAFAAPVMAAPSRAGRGSSRGELASLEQQGRRRGLGNGWEGGRGLGVGRRGGLRGYFLFLQGVEIDFCNKFQIYLWVC